MPDFELTTAGFADLESLLDLENIAFPQDPFSMELFVEALDSATSIIRIVKDEDLVVGFCMLAWQEDESLVNLANIAIHPEYRGHKLATILLDDAEEICSNMDKYFIFLEVRQSNDAAIRLYEKHGYEIHEELPGYYGDGEAALRYVKYLQPEAMQNF